MFLDYGVLSLKFALSLPHDISQECRQVSQFGTRRSTNGGCTDESVCVCEANKQLMAYKLGAREREREDGGANKLSNGIEICAVVRVGEREKGRGGSENTPSHGIGCCVVE
jgi:hypothetical protein